MHHIFVIDDEEWIRLGIVNKLARLNLGPTQIYQGESVAQAKELIKQHPCDILICDIRLMDGNGLDLCRDLLQLYPHLPVIILSGYNDFTYAQRAIQLGVLEYLLKPISIEQLQQSVQRCIEHLHNTHVHRNALEQISFDDKMKQLRSVAMRQMSTPSDILLHYLFSAYQPQSTFVAFVLSLDSAYYINPHHFAQKLFDCNRTLVLSHNFIYYEIAYNELCFVFCKNSTLSLSQEIQNFHALVSEQLQYENPTIGNIHYCMGKSDACSDFSAAVNSATFIMKHHIFYAEESLLTAQSIALFTEDATCLQGIKQEFLLCIKHGEKEKVELLCAQLFKILSEHKVCYLGLQQFYWSLIVATSFSKSLPISPPSEIYSFSSLIEFCNFLSDYIITNIKTSSNPIEESQFCQSVCNKICDYIQLEYASDISLRDIAQREHISYCYLSILFKNCVGVNFQDYLLQVRIQHAKELLLLPQYKIKDIAIQTGFVDPHYFSKVFKKSTGLTPKEYKQQLLPT